MKNIIYYFLFCIALIGTQKTSGQSIDISDLETKIAALIPSTVNDTTPGLVVGIVHNGKLIFSKGYGLSNMSYNIPNDSKMVYNIGSVSKQFLGYAFAMLHVEGKLNIDDTVNKYFTDWPEFEYKVTLRHLLSHTSGYREAYTTSNLAGRVIGVDRLSREECLNVVRKQPELEFVPGSRYTYNSTAWVILAEILEKVTGTPADEWVKTNILQKIKMKDTQIESYVGEVIFNAAESYSYTQEEGYVNEKSNRAIFGAAEVYTSMEDLAKWITNYKTAEIGGQAVNDLFFEPYILNDKKNSEYALGIFNNTYRGLRTYNHTGGHEAFITDLSYFPDQDLGIITISNFGRAARLSGLKIADLLLKEFMVEVDSKKSSTVKIKKEELEQFIGLYINTTQNATITLTLAKELLIINGRDTLIPASQNTFWLNGGTDLIKIEWLSEEKIQLTGFDDATFTKVDEWTPTEKQLIEFEGDFYSDELETTYHLILKNKKLTINHRWLGEIPLVPISKDLFKTSFGFYVHFVRDNNGKITKLAVNSNRTLNVIFSRKE